MNVTAMDEEILTSTAWRPITGFEGVYSVSAYGEVYSFRLGRRLKAYLDKDGYPRVTLVHPGRTIRGELRHYQRHQERSEMDEHPLRSGVKKEIGNA